MTGRRRADRRVRSPDVDEIDRLQQRLEQLLVRAGGGDADLVPLVSEAFEELAVVVEELQAQNAELIAGRSDIEHERERYRHLFETVPDGYVVTNSSGMIREINSTACDLFDKPRKRLVGTPLSSLVEPLDRRAFYHHLGRIRRDGPGTRMTINLMVVDDVMVPANLRATVVAGARDGDEPEIRWLVHDRRGDIETRELRSSEERLRTMFDTAPVGIALVDAHGDLVFANQLAERLLLLNAREAADWLAAVPDADVADVRSALVAAAAGETASLRHRLDGEDGSTVWVDHGISPFAGNDGVIAGSISTLTDVTVEHRTTLESARLQARLAQAERLDSVGRLAAGLAHDINNTLTTLLLRVDRIAGRVIDDASRADVEAIHDSIENTQRLIADLLSFGRRREPEPDPVDLHAEIERTMGVMRELMRSDIQVVLDVAEGDAPVHIDRGRFEQVLTNLVLNACDAMPDGGTIAVASSLVAAPVDRTGPDRGKAFDLQITVTDTGVGMEPAIVEQIFDPYFTTKSPGRGTGLGLASTYGIVTQSGGAITVDSEPGSGTTFTLRFPFARHTSPERSPEPTDRRRILVVEDDTELRGAVVAALRDSGHAVSEADDAPSALRWFETTGHVVGIDLLVTDVQLPGMSGAELSASLSARIDTLDTLFISGADPRELQRILPESARVLAKPFSVATFLDAIE